MVKTWLAKFVVVALIAGVAPVLLGPAGPAQAAGEKWYDGPNRNSPDIVNCIVYNPGPGMGGYVGYFGNLNSAAPTPSVGTPFYVHVVVAAIGNPCAGQLAWVDLRLPSGVTPAVSASAPVRCFVDGIAKDSDCSQQVLTSGVTPGAWNLGSSRAGDRSFLMPFGKTLEIAVPVTSTRSIVGEEIRARINAIDGSDNWFEPSGPLSVTGGSSPAGPSVFYPVPSTEVRGAGDYESTAFLTTQVGGSVTFQIGATTSYGLLTDTGTLPSPGTWTTTTDWRTSPGSPPNLALGTTYHWRMGFTPTGGSVIWGADQTFRTPGEAGFRVVGDGTASVCTGAALGAAIPPGNVKARIEFDCGPGPVTLTMATSYFFGDFTELVIDGGNRVTLQAAPSRRHFSAQANSNITLQDIALTGGSTTGEVLACGGAIRVGPYGALTLENVRITANSSVDGGGLCVDEASQAVVRHSVISGNTASRWGGGINNLGALTVEGGEVTGNHAQRGGGIHTGGQVTDPNNSPSPTAGLSQLSVVANTSTGPSGGIYSASPGDLSLVTSTVSANSATGPNAPVGGVIVAGSGYIVATTIANNTATYPVNAGGLAASSATLIANTVLAGNLAAGLPSNCSPVASDRPFSGGGNLESGASCGFTGGAGDLPSGDPHLQPLANNGGSNRTHAILSGSPLVDAVPPLNEIYDNLKADQRGVGNSATGKRALDGNGDGTARSDIGAFELQPESVSPKMQGLVAAGPNPATSATTEWTATFSEPVVEVDPADFVLTSTGLSGAAVQSVSPASGPATSYTITVASGTGVGTLRLDLVDNDSIRDLAGNRLGGSGLGNGSTTGGAVAVERGASTPPPSTPSPSTPPPSTPAPATPPPVGTGPAPAPAAPTPTVAVKSVSRGGKLNVNVNPNKGSGYWTFRVQKRTSAGEWKTLATRYRTRGNGETRTVNLKKGTYRVLVEGKYGYGGSTSAAVTLRR